MPRTRQLSAVTGQRIVAYAMRPALGKLSPSSTRTVRHQWTVRHRVGARSSNRVCQSATRGIEREPDGAEAPYQRLAERHRAHGQQRGRDMTPPRRVAHQQARRACSRRAAGGLSRMGGIYMYFLPSSPNPAFASSSGVMKGWSATVALK